jgi:hypothetical protein
MQSAIARCARASVNFASVVIFLGALLFGTEAVAWGVVGHRLISEIAEQHLDARSQHALHDLIGTESLADVSVWLDQQRLALRHQQPGSERWHYDDWPVCETENVSREYCRDGNCASQAYIRSLSVLRDHQAAHAIRLNALRVVVHVLEDIHQPLHAADHRDRGGNQIDVRLGPHGRHSSLHAAWDTQFLSDFHDRQSLNQVAREWLSQASSEIGLLEKGDIHSWLLESHQLARATAYGELPGFSCAVDSPVDVVLSADYTEHATHVIHRQLLRAGVRLAAVLREAL